LDVKTGSGAFMKSVDESRKLAEAMVDIGKRAGKKMCALITDMDRPLGNTIGNSLEVIEAIETLKGNGPEDLRELCVALASHMLCLAEKGDLAACEADVRHVLASGEALQKLADMVEAQGGDRRWVYEPERFPKAAYSREVCAARSGYLTHTDAEEYGRAALLLGAGRSKKEDVIDQSAGIRLLAKTGDRVEKGMPIAILYTSKEALLDAAEEVLDTATRIEDTPPTPVPLIFDTIL